MLRFLLFSVSVFSFCFLSGAEIAQMAPDNALQRLMNGNERYTNDKLQHPDRTQYRRAELTSSQNPFAIILGCSDSRVSPEIVFDQGIGDLFVVRVAGNVVGPVELDSVEFAAEFLGSSIVLVLGHENCGAVSAVLNGQTQDIEAIAELIGPAIKKVDPKNNHAFENAIKSNVGAVVQQLKNSQVMQKLMAAKKINVVGGYYHLGSGKVELIEESGR
ncbi:Carbonic anhydrase [Chlamydiales bacterium STE3]|nr:Carbonic anhydrase [Chlamydiales bacterium STE3]